MYLNRNYNESLETLEFFELRSSTFGGKHLKTPPRPEWVNETFFRASPKRKPEINKVNGKLGELGKDRNQVCEPSVGDKQLRTELMKQKVLWWNFSKDSKMSGKT